MAIKITDDDKGEVWLAERKKGLGGSDTVVLMGAGQYENQTPYFVWASKVEGYSVPMNEAMERGHALEPIVRQKYEAESGNRVIETGLWQHDEHPVILGSPDGLVVEGDTDDPADRIGGFEAKTTLDRTARSWDYDGECPPSFEWQSRHYMAIMDVPWWDVACLVVDTWEMFYWRIHRDLDKERALIAACTEFWRTYIEPGIPPEPDALMSSAEVRQRWLHPTEGVLDLDAHSTEGEQVAALYAERQMLDAEIKAREDRLKEIDNALKATAAEHDEVALDGVKLYTWREQSRTGIDSKRLKAEHPEIAQEYTKTSTFRVLRVP